MTSHLSNPLLRVLFSALALAGFSPGMSAQALPAAAQPGAVLQACADESPPFVMFAKGVPVGGFSTELTWLLAGVMGRKVQIVQLPWARCLQQVKSGAVDLAIDAYDDAERRKSYWYSSPYYTLTPQIFYKAAWPIDAIPLTGVRDLERFKGCGVHGYTYAHYDLKESQLDLGAADASRMLLKLKAGHCDYALEELEFIIGGRQFIANWPDEAGLKSIRPSWARGPQMHFLIGRARSGGEALLGELNQAIANAEKSGQTAVLRKTYFDSANKPNRKL